ncbi:hypothetical protein GCM10025867_18180 [Frondihabitans sucicola]|uniref:NAD-dependent epimerase/dehydratase domain-containing protein n=1 Tax=Frondihabitans sucicola TaxID=1268041 RepID=A0ABM8GMD4_9MICO|nr:hypothetical protein GCM10025867_18180 [Frondihabitans sucicola]
MTAALERGWAVRVLDDLRPDVHGARPTFDPRVDFREGDVRDPAAVDAALDGVTAVCHQAAKVGLGVDFQDAPDYVSTNELGTAVVLAAMARAQIDRLVVASSMVVYGEGAYRGSGGIVRPAPRRIADLDAGVFDPRDDAGELLRPELIAEDAPLDPRNVYAITKLTQEHLATSWARSTGGRAAALRYHNVYGPSMPQNTPYAGVASLFRSAIERGEALACSRTAPRGAISCTCATSPAPTSPPSTGRPSRAPTRSGPSTSVRATSTRSARWPPP